jgi:hypothetical protein
MATFVERMVRAARLDSTVYEEVEADRSATAQATAVVILAGLATGIGFTVRAGVGGLVAAAIGALIGWYVWALLTYFIGARLFREPQTRADLGELLRTLGFASAPGILRVLGVVPGIQRLVFVVTWLWMLLTMVVAVRQALDYNSTARAVAVCFIGFLVQCGVFIFLMLLFGVEPLP